MTQDHIHLLKTRRFLPLFMAQFLGAFNDNLFKNALVILIIYREHSQALSGPILISVAVGIFILPYFFSRPRPGSLPTARRNQGLSSASNSLKS